MKCINNEKNDILVGCIRQSIGEAKQSIDTKTITQMNKPKGDDMNG